MNGEMSGTKGEKMEIKLYELWFNGERICSCIRLDDALIMINALIRTYFSEPAYKVELVELQKCGAEMAREA